MITYLSLHLILSAERAQELAVLRDFHLLDGFPQAGAVPGAVLAGDPNLLGAFGHPIHLRLLKVFTVRLFPRHYWQNRNITVEASPCG